MWDTFAGPMFGPWVRRAVSIEVGVKMNNVRKVIQSLLVGLGVAAGASCLLQPAQAVTYLTTGGSQVGIWDQYVNSGFIN